MKKLLFFFSLSFLILGCTANSTSEYDIRKPVPDGVPFSTIIRFGYEGHDYIMFDSYQSTGVVHDPDCHCFTDSIK